MMELSPRMTVQELLERHPRAISVFIKGNLLCVGCPTEAFHTLEDVARIYGYPVEHLLASIAHAIVAEGPSDET